MAQPALHSVMSEAEYDKARAEVRVAYGDSRTEAGARFEQALASLFYRSGWTQEKLAAKEGKSQKWVDFRLRFGRFLNFSTDVLNSKLPLTEGKFRKYWAQTKGDERDRFKAVQRMIADDAKLVKDRRPQIGPNIKKHFADGKWHSAEEMADELEVDEDHIHATLKGIVDNGYHECKGERKKVGTETHYRIFPMDKTISAKELIEKLDPIVKGLEEQGRKNQVTMSVSAVAVLASKLRKLLHEWAE